MELNFRCKIGYHIPAKSRYPTKRSSCLMRIQNRHVVTHETYASVNLVMRIKAALDLKEAVRLACATFLSDYKRVHIFKN